MAEDPTQETRDERRARVKAAIRLMVHESERPNLDAWMEHIEEARLAAPCEHSADAADFSLTISSAVTEGLNLVCAEGAETADRTAAIFRTLAQTMGYEFGRRLRQGLAQASLDDPEARIHILASHGNAFVMGMTQCFAVMAEIEGDKARPN